MNSTVMSDAASIDQKDADVTTTPAMSLSNVALVDMHEDGTIDPVYQAKARVLNNAIQEIGMGKYQIHLFICAGFGWFAYVSHI